MKFLKVSQIKGQKLHDLSSLKLSHSFHPFQHWIIYCACSPANCNIKYRNGEIIFFCHQPEKHINHFFAIKCNRQKRCTGNICIIILRLLLLFLWTEIGYFARLNGTINPFVSAEISSHCNLREPTPTEHLLCSPFLWLLLFWLFYCYLLFIYHIIKIKKQ